MKLAALMKKQAEVGGTYLQPNTAPSSTPTKTKAPIVKTGGEPGGLETNENASYKKMPERLPQAPLPAPYVDVQGKKAPLPILEKKASIYALGDRYPLDSYEQVKMASSYFSEYLRHFEPCERREFAVKLAHRMEELYLPIPETTRKYAGSGYASEPEFKLAMDIRKNVIIDSRYKDLLDVLTEKRAELAPAAFVTMLEEFDKYAGVHNYYNSGVPDAYLSTYGADASAAQDKLAASDGETVAVGNESVTVGDLKHLSVSGRTQLISQWGEEFADEFRKDPKHIYDTLPPAQKTLIIRMASQSANGGTPT